MKLNCLLATAAVAQFDYNPNAEYDNDYNPDNTIARGVKFQRPTVDINQFAISSALSEQLSAMGGPDADSGNMTGLLQHRATILPADESFLHV